MEIVIVLVLVALFVGIVVAYGALARPQPPGEPAPSPDPWSFTIDPQVICAIGECVARIVAHATTEEANATGRVTVLMPDNRTKVLGDGLSIERNLAGNDPFFDAGLGQHVVRFEATGLRQGTIVGTSDIYLIDNGYSFGHSVRHRFPANTPDADRRQHVDVFTMGDVEGQKATRIVSICKRISLVEVRCLAVTAPPGHPLDLAVQVLDASGALVAGATMTEGSQLPVPAGAVRATGAVISTLPSGANGLFAPDAQVSWSLALRFACD